VIYCALYLAFFLSTDNPICLNLLIIIIIIIIYCWLFIYYWYIYLYMYIVYVYIYIYMCVHNAHIWNCNSEICARISSLLFVWLSNINIYFKGNSHVAFLHKKQYNWLTAVAGCEIMYDSHTAHKFASF
jgi:hypothetical protein